MRPGVVGGVVAFHSTRHSECSHPSGSSGVVPAAVFSHTPGSATTVPIRVVNADAPLTGPVYSNS
jgi:hypothetical protein